MPITGNAYQDQNYGGEAIGQLLNLVLSGATAIKQGNRDKAYRNAFAKEMGIDPSSLEGMERADLNELRKEKYKALLNPTEWKPKTKEEALAFEQAKTGYRNDTETKKFKENEATIGNKLLRGEKITPQERDFYISAGSGRYVPSSSIISDVVPKTTAIKPQGGGGGSGIGNILLQLLGGGTPISGLIGMLAPKAGAVTSPVPTTVPETVAQPGAVAPAAAPVADPIALRIKQAIDGGMDPQEVKRQLIEKGIDPAKYGL